MVKSSATVAPPIVSTTMSTSGSLSMTPKSLTKQSRYGLSGKSRTSRIYFSRTRFSTRWSISPPLVVSTSATPEPTVPKPKIATFTIPFTS